MIPKGGTGVATRAVRPASWTGAGGGNGPTLGRTIVLLGCHGAGKTTIGSRLAGLLGVPFHDEIGRRLAEDPAHRPPGVTAADRQEAFDAAVFAEELARDAAWEPGLPRIVETWHPGNLAYAECRSPRIVRARWAEIQKARARFAVLGVAFRAPRDVLRARRTEPADIDFFLDVALRAELWAARLGVPVPIAVDTGASDPDGIAEDLARRLHALLDAGIRYTVPPAWEERG